MFELRLERVGWVLLTLGCLAAIFTLAGGGDPRNAVNLVTVTFCGLGVLFLGYGYMDRADDKEEVAKSVRCSKCGGLKRHPTDRCPSCNQEPQRLKRRPGVNIVACPYCGSQVWPAGDGTCPSCGNVVCEIQQDE